MAKWKSYSDGVDIDAIRVARWTRARPTRTTPRPTSASSRRPKGGEHQHGYAGGQLCERGAHARRDGRSPEHGRGAAHLRRFPGGRGKFRHPHPATDEEAARGAEPEGAAFPMFGRFAVGPMGTKTSLKAGESMKKLTSLAALAILLAPPLAEAQQQRPGDRGDRQDRPDRPGRPDSPLANRVSVRLRAAPRRPGRPDPGQPGVRPPGPGPSRPRPPRDASARSPAAGGASARAAAPDRAPAASAGHRPPAQFPADPIARPSPIHAAIAISAGRSGGLLPLIFLSNSSIMTAGTTWAWARRLRAIAGCAMGRICCWSTCVAAGWST